MKNNETFGTVTVGFSYVIWGFLTLFWNLLYQVSSIYILCQRIIWAVVFMAVYLTFTKGWAEIAEIFKNKRSLLICFTSGALITINWGAYIMAVTGGHVLDSSLGYFIEPIAVALIGTLLFRERMSRDEIITFVFATAGLSYLLIASKAVPGIALIIAFTFSAYGAVKKSLSISAQASLFMETLCMAPFALLVSVYMDIHGMGSVNILHGAQFWLLPACGIVTSVPLLLFNMGVRNIPYYITGILMYISPTISFILGLVYFHENLDLNQFIAFGLIWIGILFTLAEKVKLIQVNKQERSHA